MKNKKDRTAVLIILFHFLPIHSPVAAHSDPYFFTFHFYLLLYNFAGGEVLENKIIAFTGGRFRRFGNPLRIITER